MQSDNFNLFWIQIILFQGFPRTARQYLERGQDEARCCTKINKKWHLILKDYWEKILYFGNGLNNESWSCGNVCSKDIPKIYSQFKIYSEKEIKTKWWTPFVAIKGASLLPEETIKEDIIICNYSERLSSEPQVTFVF